MFKDLKISYVKRKSVGGKWAWLCKVKRIPAIGYSDGVIPAMERLTLRVLGLQVTWWRAAS